ncbi:uncharacterized protein LOC142464305 [Ascaphus truei]|uniref:uncharacterized protein LOC142464305 n=1 Tax=Ascaphus truei TaxID=8439 RepID=UPI003F5A7374
MGYWEELAVWQNVGLGAGLVYYGRFIDDLIFIWDGEEDDFRTIIRSFDENYLGLKFTFDIHANSVVFLDLVLEVDEDANLLTKTHFKALSVNNYVHAESNHASRWLNNIPLGQFHRMKRNCTKDGDFVTQSQLLELKFRDKEFDTQLVKQSFDRVAALDRSSLLEQSRNKRINNMKHYTRHTPDTSMSLRFITGYNQSANTIGRILNKHWDILKCDPHLGPHLLDKASIVFRKARNMKNILAPTKINNNHLSALSHLRPAGNHRCGRTRCITCSHLSTSDQFVSFVKGNTHSVLGSITCISMYIIYMLTCGCGKQYVGRTMRPLSARFLEHRRSIVNGVSSHGIYRYFEMVHNKDPKTLKIIGLEYISPLTLGGDRFKKLCRRETYWIYQLATLAPGGFNESIDTSTIV